MLVVAGAHWVILVPVSLLMRSRREAGRMRVRRIKRHGYREGEREESKRKVVDRSIMKDARLCLLFVSGIFAVSGQLTPFYFINCKCAWMVPPDITKACKAMLFFGTTLTPR